MAPQGGWDIAGKESMHRQYPTDAAIRWKEEEIRRTVKNSLRSALKLVTVVPVGGKKEYTKFDPFDP